MSKGNINNNGDVLLQKFYLEFMDGQGRTMQYSQECLDGSGLRKIELPFNLNVFTPDKLTLKFFGKGGISKTYTDKSLLGRLLNDCGSVDFRKEFFKDEILKLLPSDYLLQEEDDACRFPTINYSDVTERDMFGYNAISETDLRSAQKGKGIWGGLGFRKFRITVDSFDFDKSPGDLKRSVSFYWTRIDKLTIDSPMFEEKVLFDKKDKSFCAYIDTNRLQKCIREYREELNSYMPLFTGRFEIHDEYLPSGVKKTFAFPISIIVHDSDYEYAKKSKLLNTGIVSLDFGTSSTCAAVMGDGKPELLTISGEAKQSANDGNPYENPTNLMVFRWDEICRQWDAENDNPPFFLTKDDEHNEEEADYDSGYTVEEVYKEVGDEKGPRKMAAIITQLKSIPYALEHGKEVKFTPYWDKNQTPVLVIDNLEDMGEKRFNAIAFYGYLLSRAINNPAKPCFYVNYYVTFPVKFSKEVREKIRASLEYGIKRALPKSIREAKGKNGDPVIKVIMNYQEPVACVGEIVGQQLKLGNDGAKPRLFAVYDIGGGSLDFAFGMFRKATEDEINAKGFEYVIDILGIGGDDKIGGEKLIHRLAYKIYLDNSDLMEEHKIKFVLPPGELMPKRCKFLDVKGDEISDANVSIMMEQLGRPLFKYEDTVENHLESALEDVFDSVERGERIPDGTHVCIDLRSDSEKDVDKLPLEISGVDEFLAEEIEKTVKNFEKEMKQSFENNLDRLRDSGISEFNVQDVAIFLGGNASKQHWVRKKLEETFDGCKIESIGEGIKDDRLARKYEVNEKTSVAFGQLRLGQFNVKTDAIAIEGMPPFLYNVGYVDVGTGAFKPLICKNETKKKWVRANRIIQNTMTDLLYTTDPDPFGAILTPLQEDVSEFFEDPGKCTIYVRICTEKSIEFRIGAFNETPDDAEPVNDEMVLILS